MFNSALSRSPTAPGAPAGAVPVGAGPFVLETSGHERWRFRANPHFYGGAPPLPPHDVPDFQCYDVIPSRYQRTLTPDATVTITAPPTTCP